MAPATPGGRKSTAVHGESLRSGQCAPAIGGGHSRNRPALAMPDCAGALNNGVSNAAVSRVRAANSRRLTRLGPPPISPQSPRRPVRRGSLLVARQVPEKCRVSGASAPAASASMRNRKDLTAMIGGLARKLFGSANERRIKQLPAARRRDQRAGEGAGEALRRRAARAHRRVQEGARRRQDARRHPGAGLRDRAARRPSARSASAISTCS